MAGGPGPNTRVGTLLLMESTTSGLTVDAESMLRLGWYGLGILAVALFVDLFPSRFPALGAKRNPGQERVMQMLMDLASPPL